MLGLCFSSLPKNGRSLEPWPSQSGGPLSDLDRTDATAALNKMRQRTRGPEAGTSAGVQAWPEAAAEDWCFLLERGPFRDLSPERTWDSQSLAAFVHLPLFCDRLKEPPVLLSVVNRSKVCRAGQFVGQSDLKRAFPLGINGF